MRGTVKFFYPDKGYGFITGEDRKEVFVHRYDLVFEPFLKTGDSVEFEIRETPKGTRASNVKKVSTENDVRLK